MMKILVLLLTKVFSEDQESAGWFEWLRYRPSGDEVLSQNDSFFDYPIQLWPLRYFTANTTNLFPDQLDVSEQNTASLSKDCCTHCYANDTECISKCSYICTFEVSCFDIGSNTYKKYCERHCASKSLLLRGSEASDDEFYGQEAYTDVLENIFESSLDDSKILQGAGYDGEGLISCTATCRNRVVDLCLSDKCQCSTVQPVLCSLIAPLGCAVLPGTAQ